jgi:enterochelin esterase-like enzyme
MSRLICRRDLAIIAILAAGALTAFAFSPACHAQDAKKKTFPEPQWVATDTSDASGAKYHTFVSKTLGGEVSYHIYLPPQYDEQPSRRFPVIYWLHGLGGNQRGGTATFGKQAADAMRDGALPPALIVFVNGMVSSFYVDWANDKRPVESIIIKDLIPHVDATYRTIAKREGRAIEGYSMGGWGAAHLGFKYPELFGTVVVDAGALIQEQSWNGPNLAPIFDGAFNNDKDRITAEHPTQLLTKNADKIRGQQNIRVGCGGEDTLLARNRALHELLTKLNIDHEYEVVEGIAHNAGQYYAKLGPQGFAIYKKAFASLAGSP